ncbi:MAG: hypothetical protein ED559_01025 [Phycisphaera sp.]|nr:MAG: hypothetical protein ED559_01025 [Phycisphaera sp.]
MGRDARIWFLGEGEDRSSWERALAGGGWVDGECLKLDDRGRGVWRAELLGRSCVVKARPLPGVLDRLKQRLGATDLARACLGAALLEAKGFRTPRVHVMGLSRLDSGWHEVLFTECALGVPLLSQWIQADDAERRGLARRAGRVLGEMCAAGVFNRDCKPSNLIVDGDGIVFVDVGGVRATNGDTVLELARMISMLGFEPTGVGSRPAFWEVVVGIRSALRTAGVASEARGRLIAHLRRLVAEHGDPTPRDNPVAPKADLR